MEDQRGAQQLDRPGDLGRLGEPLHTRRDRERVEKPMRSRDPTDRIPPGEPSPPHLFVRRTFDSLSSAYRRRSDTNTLLPVVQPEAVPNPAAASA